MNNWQLAKQLQYLLRQRKWEGNSGYELVFASDSVRITSGITESALTDLRTPFVLIKMGGGLRGDEEPGLLEQTYELLLCCSVQGDSIGENAILGSNRTDNSTSKNRGLAEVEEELLEVVRQINANQGVKIIVRSMSEADAVELDGYGYVVTRTYRLTAYCTDKRFYHSPIRLLATGGVGSVSLSWTLPPDRYDRREIIVRRASGSTAPATVTDGTGVTLAGLLDTSVSDSGLGAGTYSYSVFAGYSEYSPFASQRYSEPIKRESVVVT